MVDRGLFYRHCWDGALYAGDVKYFWRIVINGGGKFSKNIFFFVQPLLPESFFAWLMYDSFWLQVLREKTTAAITILHGDNFTNLLSVFSGVRQSKTPNLTHIHPAAACVSWPCVIIIVTAVRLFNNFFARVSRVERSICGGRRRVSISKVDYFEGHRVVQYRQLYI